MSTRCIYCKASITRKNQYTCNRCQNDADRRHTFNPTIALWAKFVGLVK